jgi:MFS family permease
MWNIVTVTLRQRIVPNDMLGRVNSAYRMIGWGLMPAGAVAGGLVAHVAGLRAPYVIAGVLCGITTLAALPLLRE